jgi:hypothetical protein
MVPVVPRVVFHSNEVCRDRRRFKIESDHKISDRLYVSDDLALENAVVVSAASVAAVCYLALSYVWGDGTQVTESQTEKNFDIWDNMPRTVQDAITVNKELGYRYLWVDDFCINQQNSSEKFSQTAQMDKIYSGADLSIVAAAGKAKSYGIPGVGKTRRVHHAVIRLDNSVVFGCGPEPSIDVKSDSTWSSRAWTFQEGVLSNRLLAFTDHQMTFYYQKTSWMEALGGPDYANQLVDNWSSWPVRVTVFEPYQDRRRINSNPVPWVRFTHLTKLYTRRLLSYQTDTRAAVSGNRSEGGFRWKALALCCSSLHDTPDSCVATHALPHDQEFLPVAGASTTPGRHRNIL